MSFLHSFFLWNIASKLFWNNQLSLIHFQFTLSIHDFCQNFMVFNIRQVFLANCFNLIWCLQDKFYIAIFEQPPYMCSAYMAAACIHVPKINVYVIQTNTYSLSTSSFACVLLFHCVFPQVHVFSSNSLYCRASSVAASSVPGPHGWHCVAEGPGENQNEKWCRMKTMECGNWTRTCTNKYGWL
jgi:hypothetical protein